MASSVPRGRPSGGPDHHVRNEERHSKTATCRHVDESGKASPCTPFSHLWTIGIPAGSVAHANAKIPDSFRKQREKDEIRQERPVQYLTQAARFAKLPVKLATLGPRMATLRGDFGNLRDPKWQP